MNTLTAFEINFLLSICKENRENSASLAQIPDQRWKKEHEIEVQKMDRLIPKLEALLHQTEIDD